MQHYIAALLGMIVSVNIRGTGWWDQLINPSCAKLLWKINLFDWYVLHCRLVCMIEREQNMLNTSLVCLFAVWQCNEPGHQQSLCLCIFTGVFWVPHVKNHIVGIETQACNYDEYAFMLGDSIHEGPVVRSFVRSFMHGAMLMSRWCDDMEVLSALLALCEWIPAITGGFHSRRVSNTVILCLLWC